MNIEKLKKKDLIDLIIEKDKTNKSNKKLLKQILKERIFPIIISKKYYINKNKILNIKNLKKNAELFQIPKGLYLNKVCDDTKYLILNKLLNEYIKKKNIGYGKKFLFENKKIFGFNGLDIVFKGH